MNLEEKSRLVKQNAKACGFDFCGIARAVPLEDDARRLEQWLAQGMQGGMSYMERHFDLRVDPAKLVPGARSVISLLLNYYPAQPVGPPADDRPKIAKYALGEDYHEVIREKLKRFMDLLRQGLGAFHGRGFVDSAPVLEKTWAFRSGLGWIGKNGNLIRRQGGSFYFIANLIVDIELAYDEPYARDYCGSCRKCIDACPTGALLDNKMVDGSRCIAYFTIELKDELIPEKMNGQWKDWLFGCDICQDVCPWNRFAEPSREEAFEPKRELLEFSYSDWENFSEIQFREKFRDSPLRRAKWSGIRRNLRFLKNKPTGRDS
jgi:epoxyqueuosine reductase